MSPHFFFLFIRLHLLSMVYLPLCHVCHKVSTDQHPGVCTATSSRQTVCPTAFMNSVNQHAVVHASAMRITPVAYSKSSNPEWHRSWGANNKQCCISHYALAAVMLIRFCELCRSRNGISFRLSQGHLTQLGKTYVSKGDQDISKGGNAADELG